MSKKIIFVTGASGFIGQNLVKYLISKKYDLKILVSEKNKYMFLGEPGIEVIVGDLKNSSVLRKYLKQVYWVLHLAAKKSDERDSFIVNVEGTKNLVNIAKQNRVIGITYISTQSVKIKNKGVYAVTKLQGENIVKNSKLKYVILRPSLVYGKNDSGAFSKLVKLAKLPLTPIIGDGSWASAPVEVSDLAKIIEKSMILKKSWGHTFDIGGPDVYNQNELNELLKSKLKLKYRVIHIPVFPILTLAKLLSRLIKKSPLTVSNVLGSTQNVDFNNSKALKVFGVRPIKLAEGLNHINFNNETISYLEAEFLYKYILGANYHVLREGDFERYYKGLSINKIEIKKNLIVQYPWVIGPMDAISKVFAPQSILQRKLKLAGLILECHPVSYNWLRPKNQSILKICIAVFSVAVSAGYKFLIGFILLLIPDFYRKYVYEEV